MASWVVFCSYVCDRADHKTTANRIWVKALAKYTFDRQQAKNNCNPTTKQPQISIRLLQNSIQLLYIFRKITCGYFAQLSQNSTLLTQLTVAS